MALPPTQEIKKDRVEKIRQACIQAAQEAYEDAGLRGLCHEGRWELAIDAMKQAKLDHIDT